MTRLITAVILAACVNGAIAAELEEAFRNPPDSARPWVYWTQSGHYSLESATADLEAMKKAGIGGVVRMDCSVGQVPGGTPFLGEEWRRQFVHSVHECERLGLAFTTITGPGWTGTGGPWIKVEQSMQHLIPATVTTKGPARFDQVLPLPQPRISKYHRIQTPQMQKQISEFYEDVALLAFPRREPVITDIQEKALHIRNPFTSMKGVRPYLPSPVDCPAAEPSQVIDPQAIIDLSGKLQADGRLAWDVPPGEWTIVRLGVRSTGANTRPAPTAGLGWESDKFSKQALAAHFEAYFDPLLREIGPRPRDRKTGYFALDADSWEMSSQNWTTGFREEFKRRRGYDPWQYFATYTGCVVGSREQTERFLWDVRRTCQELLLENHAAELKEMCHQRGLRLMIEPYDMNPAGDLDLGSYADFPAGEFWYDRYQSAWSCITAASIAHTMGKPIVLAEGFTSGRGDWARSPWVLKNQTDWAFAAGINKFAIHGFAHQADESVPGMTFGPYGVFWNRKLTFWPLVGAYHKYLARCSYLLQQGVAVSDILYLTPEGTPQVFQPPATAMHDAASRLPDKKGYAFDGCSPRILMERAVVQDGRITFPGGTQYRLLVLPQWKTMTPQLLAKVKELVQAGASVVGHPPAKSPSLSDYPKCDEEVLALAETLWGALDEPNEVTRRHYGSGRIWWGGPLSPASNQPVDILKGSSWIWYPEGQPAAAAPAGKRLFRRTVEVDPNRKLVAARAALTADNSFVLWINDEKVGEGNDFHFVSRFPIDQFLRPGANDVAIEAVNGGSDANPAGLIAAVELTYEDGDSQLIQTDATWKSGISPAALYHKRPRSLTLSQSQRPTGANQGRPSDSSPLVGGPAALWKDAVVLGPRGMPPWNLGPPIRKDELYPRYEQTASILKEVGMREDFSSTGSPRYMHRRTADRDIYFVSNTSDQRVNIDCTFRVGSGQPELWDPVTGTVRALAQYERTDGLTTIPITFFPYQSFFVVFRRCGATRAAAASNTVNFPESRRNATLEGPWQVSFDPKRGGPDEVRFDTLYDWTKAEHEGIKYYSGIATYRKTFDLPPTSGRQLYLDLGTVHEIARIRLNGKVLGVVWCAPWRIDISTAVQAGENDLEIEVANLWPNRLIGDAASPPEKRFTVTNLRVYREDSPLLPSGLLGPVTLQEVTP